MLLLLLLLPLLLVLLLLVLLLLLLLLLLLSPALTCRGRGRSLCPLCRSPFVCVPFHSKSLNYTVSLYGGHENLALCVRAVCVRVGGRQHLPRSRAVYHRRPCRPPPSSSSQIAHVAIGREGIDAAALQHLLSNRQSLHPGL